MVTGKRVKITETVLRDGHQSIAATRMHTSQMLPVLEALDEVGYHSLECWGGATFDASMRFLNENPWERLRLLKKHVKKTPLQMVMLQILIMKESWTARHLKAVRQRIRIWKSVPVHLFRASRMDW